MKVLWFTNSPVSANNQLNMKYVGEGWIGALEKYISKEETIELGICCQSKIQSIEKLIIEHTTYFIVPNIVSKNPDRINKTNLNNYLKVIHNFKPDIIQIFGTENDYGYLIPEIKIPVVIHIQGNLTVYNHKYFQGLTKIDLIKYSRIKEFLKRNTLLHKFNLLEKRAKRERLIFNFCSYFIGRTSWDKRIVEVFATGSNYFHCEEAIREEFFNNQWKKQKRDRIKLTSIVRSNFYKGLDTVIETSELLKRHNFNFDWNIIGTDISDRIAKIYSKKYHTNYIDLNIKFFGKKDAKEIVDILLDSDIYVHPSHIENSPNSICEAMVMGVPTIATSVGGVLNLLENEKEGILIQDGDPYVMAGAIVQLTNNENMQISFSQNARNRALARHDIVEITKRLFNIYTQILKDYK